MEYKKVVFTWSNQVQYKPNLSSGILGIKILELLGGLRGESLAFLAEACKAT